MTIRETEPFIKVGKLGIGTKSGAEVPVGQSITIDEGIDDAGSNEYATIATVINPDVVRIDWFSGYHLSMTWISNGPGINHDKYLNGKLRWTAD